MAKIVLTNAFISLAGVDISSFARSVTISTTYETIDTTKVGDSDRSVIAGVATNSITLELMQDFASNQLEQLIYPTNATKKLGTSVAMEVRPQNTTVSATNPKYTFNALITSWTSLNGAVGALSTVQVSWPISGAISKATS
jgi:hypothetical protein